MRLRLPTAIASAALVVLTAVPASAGAQVELDQVGTFDKPVYVTSPPGDTRRVFVVERDGRVRVLVDGVERSEPFMDLTAPVNSSGGEQGLLSIAFAPDYAQSRRVYAYYTRGDGDVVIAELRREPDSSNRVDHSSRRTVLVQEHGEHANHNGGQLQFGPHDGLLYAGLGDGGGAGDQDGNGQDPGTLLGKLIRIDPRQSGGARYTTPVNNPFVGRPGRDEIYSLGLRNPFRFSFDVATGDLAIGDVGEGEREEIDFEPVWQARGANFGWSCFEGTLRFKSCQVPGHDTPVLQKDHDDPSAGGDGYCAITGGYVIRDQRLDASLRGRYLYGDFCQDGLRTARLAADGATGDDPLGVSVPSLSSFGQDARRRLYAASLQGAVYRIDPAG